MSASRRPSLAFRAVLWLLPKHVRSEHEQELRQFLELDAADGPHGRAAYWWLLLWDVVKASPSAHIDILRQDLVIAFRQLRRAPAYAVVAALTLAVGIGGNAALFTLVDHALLQPPPFIGVDRIVSLSEEHTERGLLRFGMNPANFRDFVEGADDLIEAGAVWQTRSGTALLDDRPDRVSYAAVTSDLFRVFREAPALGRALRPDDDVPGANAAVLSHTFWATRLGSDPSAIGRMIEINAIPYRVVGVMPAGFEYPTPTTAVWTSLGLTDDDLSRRGARWLGATMRLRAGVEPRQLADRTAATARSLSEQYPETNGGWGTSVLTLHESATSSVRAPLLLVWLAASLILLIAIANVASLLFGRAVARRDELTLRRALGARSTRLVRQTLTEGTVLATLGASIGIGLAAVLLAQLRRGGLDVIPRAGEIGLDARTIGFTAILALLVTLVFSVVPAMFERGARSGGDVRSRGFGGSLSRARLQTGLVIGEIALAVVVAVGTGLLARSASRLLDQPLGYEPQGVTTFRIEPPMRVDPDQPIPELMAAIGRDRARASATYEAFLDRLRAEPAVAEAGGVSRLPLTGRWWITGFDMPGATSEPDDYVAYIRVILPGYLAAMGTSILEGRALDATDVAGAERAIVIDEAFARRYFGDRSPVGEVILLDGPPDQPPPQARIVGVAETVRQASLEDTPRPTFYASLPQAIEGHGSNWGMDIVLRSDRGLVSEEAIRTIALDFFPDAAVFRVLSMEDMVSSSFAGRRFQLVLFAGFAAVALALTLVGVFGVLALHVRERTREFGVRVAVGASPWRIQWLVQRNALVCVAWGSVIGLAAAALLGRAFESLVYGVSIYDPIAFVTGPMILAIVALTGGLIPAWHATRTDPAEVLRSD